MARWKYTISAELKLQPQLGYRRPLFKTDTKP